jgi:hypothetical protein
MATAAGTVARLGNTVDVGPGAPRSRLASLHRWPSCALCAAPARVMESFKATSGELPFREPNVNRPEARRPAHAAPPANAAPA